MAEISVRPATDEDVPRILETLRAALGETPLLRRTPELWAWKHVQNPFGQSLTLVAEQGNRLAGVRAMMRWELITPEGQTIRCLRPVDTATHPDFMRRGIFRQLTLAAIDRARTEGVHLVFNTPNDRSAPGYLQMGWRVVARLNPLVRPRVGMAAQIPSGTAPSIARLAPGLDTPDDVVIEDRPPRGLRTRRSETYFDWRFTAHPTASYGILRDNRGAVIVRASSRRGRSELVVSDVLGGAGAGSIRRMARRSRARYMAGWFSPGSPERRLALRAGMLPIPNRTLQLVALPLTDLDVRVFDLASWDMATSDLELL